MPCVLSEQRLLDTESPVLSLFPLPPQTLLQLRLHTVWLLLHNFTMLFLAFLQFCTFCSSWDSYMRRLKSRISRSICLSLADLTAWGSYGLFRLSCNLFILNKIIKILWVLRSRGWALGVTVGLWQSNYSVLCCWTSTYRTPGWGLWYCLCLSYSKELAE